MKTLLLVALLAFAAPQTMLAQSSTSQAGDCNGTCVTSADCKNCKNCPYCHGMTQACLPSVNNGGDDSAHSSSSSHSKRGAQRRKVRSPKRQPSGGGHSSHAHK